MNDKGKEYYNRVDNPNPFQYLIQFDSNNKLINPRLIGVASQCGGGKTISIHTMILNYVKAGIDVVFFTEDISSRSLRLLFNYMSSLENRKANFHAFTVSALYEKYIEFFNDKLKNFLEFSTNKNMVIVIDSVMLFKDNGFFSYKKLNSENTRFVICEKYNKKSRLDLLKQEEENPYIKSRLISETLRDLAMAFNTHVIVSLQLNANLNNINSSTNTGFLYTCDTLITSQKTETSTFLIKKQKERYCSSNTVFECRLDENNLTFATIN